MFAVFLIKVAYNQLINLDYRFFKLTYPCFDALCKPSIAQLVERWTVVGELISIGRWFKSGSKDFFFTHYFINNFLFLFTIL